jgi:hypothetical protein
MSDPQQLRYTVDVTSKDIDAIEAFLGTRTAQQSAAHARGSAEHRIADALELLVESLVIDARWALTKLAGPTETSLHGGELSLRHDIKDAWNRLTGAASRWHDDPGFDATRWRRITHTDASYEQSAERGIARAQADREARKAMGK